jgi:energy-coupling factor transport system ATP-binding protein
MLFQNPDNQMVAVTVDKEVAFALENLAVSPAVMAGQITEVLRRLGISHLRERMTAELSGGEKQRVALASMMIFRPPILVLDEPDSYLDEPGKRALELELGDIRREAPETVVVRVTQYPHIARTYRRLLVFNEGRLVADGRPEAILSNQHRLFSRGSVGGRPVAVNLPPSLIDPKPAAARLARIRCDQTGFAYPGGPPVITRLSMTIKQGEIWAVVGPSGSGKSTLAQLLCGLLKPSSGAIDYIDETGRTMSGSDLTGQISAVFQMPERQFFLPTSAEEIAFGPRNLKQSPSREEVAAYFSLVGLDPKRFAARDPFTLSAGEKRRLAFAAVLSMSPRFVVFDEPTCALDFEGVERFRVLAENLSERQVGVMIITHDGNLIQALADRVLYLRANGGHMIMERQAFLRSPEAAVVSPVEPND